MNRGDFNLFPNMFTILVGHTGLGKGRSVNPAVGLLREAGVANILSDKLTIQYILEKISDRGQAVAQLNLGGPSGMVSFGLDATCFVSAPEIEDLLTMSDAMPTLKELWEAKDGPFEYGTRNKGLVKVAKPCPTLLGGCTPSQIALLFPSKAVGGGFVRRCNFVYESERAKVIPWPIERNGGDVAKMNLINDLKHIATNVKGRFDFDPHARKMFEDYYRSTDCDEFADEATSSYENSRPIHALKLAMCLTASRFDSMVINFVDMSKAIEMVNKVTDELKKVFRAVGDSEQAIIMDKVMRYIEIKTKASFCTRQDLMAALWKDVGSSQNLDIILATLEAGHLIRTENRMNVTVYRIVKQKHTQAYSTSVQ